MRAAEVQLGKGHFFAFEHPASATSWSQGCVQRVLAHADVQVVVFDQCMLGLVTKVHKTPTRKRTMIATNMPHLVALLRNFRCDRSHRHQRIESSEGGMKRSVWAQFYPEPLCQKLAESAQLTLADRS